MPTLPLGHDSLQVEPFRRGEGSLPRPFSTANPRESKAVFAKRTFQRFDPKWHSRPLR